MTAQATSDAAHLDPSRNVAAALMRLAKSWIDGQRTCDRLEQMRRQLDTLRELHLRRLEQGERERLCKAPSPVGSTGATDGDGYVGLGLTDKAGTVE